MALLVTAAALAALGVLTFSGISHASRPGKFRQLLERQRVWPPRTRPALLVGMIGIELLLGLGGLFVLLSGIGAPPLARAVFAAATVLFLAYLAFAAYLLRRRPGAPCACGSTSEVVNGWTVARAGILAAAALAAAIAPQAVEGPLRPGMYGIRDPAGYAYRTAFNLRRSWLRRLAMAAAKRPEPASGRDEVEAAERRVDVLRALAELPRTQREALVLVAWADMTAEEAARVLGIQPVSVRGRVHRAKATLRQRMGGPDG